TRRLLMSSPAARISFSAARARVVGKPASSSVRTTRSATRSRKPYVVPSPGVTNPEPAQYRSWAAEHPDNRAACAVVYPTGGRSGVVAAEAVAPLLAALTEHAAQSAVCAQAARQCVESGAPELAHVPFDDEGTTEHHRESECADPHARRKREDEEDESAEESERSPTDHPRRMPVQRRA